MALMLIAADLTLEKLFKLVIDADDSKAHNLKL
jgi:hypothetical protein